MAALKGILTAVRKQGGNLLKLIGLGTIGSKVTNAGSGMADAMTIGIIAVVAFLLIGGGRR